MEKIDKYYSIHYPSHDSDFGDCVCEADTIDDAMECARVHLETQYGDNGDYVCTDVSMILCINYENGHHSIENVDISIDARKVDDTRRADYYSSVL